MLKRIQTFLYLYSWRYPLSLVALWRRHAPHHSYLNTYWRTSDFAAIQDHRHLPFARKERFLAACLYTAVLLQIASGLILLVFWQRYGWEGSWQFGLALIVSYPLVVAHTLPLFVGVWWLLHPKALGRTLLCSILEAQVRRLRRKHAFDVVAVVGSVGKTSTKMAVARALQASRRVQWQEGNYNDRVTVPLIFFGHSQPGIFNIPAWLAILFKNEIALNRPYPYQVVVVELGPDGPGQMRHFAYLKPELVIVTAISAEHMEYFVTLDAVASEELTSLHFAQRALVNIDDTPLHYLEDRNYISYGLRPGATYHMTKRKKHGFKGQSATFHIGQDDSFNVSVPLLGDQGAKIAVAAAAACHMLHIPIDDIKKGIAVVTAFSGRMQILSGIQDSTLIDDTYNSSPVATKAALDVLQSGQAPQRIAILGSMNELGDYASEAHREVGEHCDPTKLDWVVTVGEDAKTYLAPVAKKRGCKVKSFLDPYRAGDFVKKQLIDGAVVLAKGSQNRVFTEEALKVLLADEADAAKLVRQSASWMAIKGKQFPS